jgi:hypothetical protein
MIWIKRLMLTLVLFHLTACGGIEIDTTSYREASVERAFVPYIESFERDCNEKVDIHLRFSYIKTKNIFTGQKIIGYCWPIYPRFINIDLNWWINHTDKSEREELIYHELGHCILYRMHNDKKDKYGNKQSIMYSSGLIGPYRYKKYKKKYVKELCGK